jgi:hypothetical protein
MTIAVCYMSPEGLVLGADSTSSAVVSPGGIHYFNHNQKLFELGENGALAVLTWGLGGLGPVSHRSLIAAMADDLQTSAPTTVADVAGRWADRFWSAYSTSRWLLPARQKCLTLAAKTPFDPEVDPQAAGARTKEEEEQFRELARGLVVGFCVGGYVLPDRTPRAYEIIFDPLRDKPAPVEIPQFAQRFWGAPNVIQRMIFGADEEFKKGILNSGNWNGTADDLQALIVRSKL